VIPPELPAVDCCLSTADGQHLKWVWQHAHKEANIVQHMASLERGGNDERGGPGITPCRRALLRRTLVF